MPQNFLNQAKPSGWVSSSNFDFVSLDKNDQWYIAVDHLPDAPFFNPLSGAEIISWLKEWKMIPSEYSTLEEPNFEVDGIPAVKIFRPGRPQSFDADIIFLIKNSKLFRIQILVEREDVKKICNQILSTFKFAK